MTFTSINNLLTHVVGDKMFLSEPKMYTLIFFQSLLHVFGVNLVLTGDSLLDGENSLMILNHPTR